MLNSHRLAISFIAKTSCLHSKRIDWWNTFLARDLQVLTYKLPNYTPYASNWFFSLDCLLCIITPDDRNFLIILGEKTWLNVVPERVFLVKMKILAFKIIRTLRLGCDVTCIICFSRLHLFDKMSNIFVLSGKPKKWMHLKWWRFLRDVLRSLHYDLMNLI